MTPLERAARAIAWDAASEAYGKDVTEAERDDYAENWRDYTHVARAVLQAIREPSEAMLRAAQAVDFIGAGENDSRGEWQAMIDAALEQMP